MNAYIVRINERTPQQGELVGIFVCELADLPYNVDQCTDPGICEYAVAGAGGIYWNSQAPALPFTDPNDDGDDALWIECTPPTYCEQWADKLFSKLNWKPVV